MIEALAEHAIGVARVAPLLNRAAVQCRGGVADQHGEIGASAGAGAGEDCISILCGDEQRGAVIPGEDTVKLLFQRYGRVFATNGGECRACGGGDDL